MWRCGGAIFPAYTSPQTVQQVMGTTKIRRIKAFCELTVDGLQQLKRSSVLSLTLPQLGQVAGRAQLPGKRSLTTGDLQTAEKNRLNQIAGGSVGRQ